MSHQEGSYFATKLALGGKIVKGMNSWSLDLAESITKQPATHIHLQYIDLESMLTRLVPVTRSLTIYWIFILSPRVVRQLRFRVRVWWSNIAIEPQRASILSIVRARRCIQG